MLHKAILVLATSVVVMTMGAGTAHAERWDLIADESGRGRVTVRAWTRNYNQVAFIANHAGTRVDVGITVDCRRNGERFHDTWSDGGTRFRFILRGLADEGRCDHKFRVHAHSSSVRLDLAVRARG